MCSITRCATCLPNCSINAPIIRGPICLQSFSPGNLVSRWAWWPSIASVLFTLILYCVWVCYKLPLYVETSYFGFYRFRDPTSTWALPLVQPLQKIPTQHMDPLWLVLNSIWMCSITKCATCLPSCSLDAPTIGGPIYLPSCSPGNPTRRGPLWRITSSLFTLV